MSFTVSHNVADEDFVKASVLLDAKDARRAIVLFRRAASRGSVSAQMMLGYLYDTGTGVSPSRKHALAWYRKAARRGDAAAAANVGLILAAEGNKRAAFKWFGRAYERGLPEVLLDVAKLQKPTAAKRTLQQLLRHRHIVPDVREDAQALLAAIDRV